MTTTFVQKTKLQKMADILAQRDWVSSATYHQWTTYSLTPDLLATAEEREDVEFPIEFIAVTTKEDNAFIIYGGYGYFFVENENDTSRLRITEFMALEGFVVEETKTRETIHARRLCMAY